MYHRHYPEKSPICLLFLGAALNCQNGCSCVVEWSKHVLAGLRLLCWLVCPEASWNVAAGFCFKTLLVLPFVMNNHVSPLTGVRFPGVPVAISVITVPSWHSHLSLNLRSHTVSREMQDATFGWAIWSLEAQCLYLFVCCTFQQGQGG